MTGDEPTTWATVEQMARAFGRSENIINEHLRTLRAEGVIKPNMARKLGRESRPNSKGGPKPLEYNLKVVIQVGFKVGGERGEHFRKWATDHIHRLMLQGATTLASKPGDTASDTVALLLRAAADLQRVTIERDAGALI